MNLFRTLATLVVITSATLFSDEPASQAQAERPRIRLRPAAVVANEQPAPPPPEVCCPERCVDNHRIQIGGNYTYAWVTPTAEPTTKGSLGGAQGIYEYRPENSVYAAVEFDWRQGTTHGGVSKRGLLDLNTQERVGYTYVNGNATYRFALFAGLGGRYMSEKVTVGRNSATFNYTHFYVPVGFLYDYDVNCWLNWGLNFQWRPQIYPTVQIILLDGSRWMVTKHIDNYYVDMPITFKFAEHFSCIVDPFFEIWHDGKSIAETLTRLALDLPGNKYYFAGVNVNLAWQF